MGKHFITTCGTSIIWGKNLLTEEIEPTISARIQETSGTPDFLRKLSAETNGLLALEAGKQDHVTLIVTDTEDGKICASAIQKLIQSQFCCSVDIESIEGLQVKDAVEFKTHGVSNLFKKLTEVTKKHSDMTAILNVTGGFKPVIPYMVLYGLFNELEMDYLFQNSEQLIKLPPAPLGVDFSRAGKFIETLFKVNEGDLLTENEFQQLAKRIPYNDKAFFNSLFYEENGYMFFSAFGEIVMDKYRIGILTVMVSPVAIKMLNSTKGLLRKKMESLLVKIATPTYREGHIDRGWAATTNLLVTKPGDVSERAAFFVKSGHVYVCELFTDHNKYTLELQNRKIEDYDITEFKEFQIIDESSAGENEPDSEDGVSESMEIESVLEENRKLKQRIQKLNIELTDARNKIKTHENFKARKKGPKKKPKSSKEKSDS
jgi:putative CRISPR-associated protein (TIGR02619 family)